MKYLNLLIFALLFSFSAFAIGPITGDTAVCAGSTITLSDATTGGTWSSSNAAVATINISSGTLTALVSGTTTVTYSTTGGSASSIITVNLQQVSISNSILHSALSHPFPQLQ